MQEISFRRAVALAAAAVALVAGIIFFSSCGPQSTSAASSSATSDALAVHPAFEIALAPSESLLQQAITLPPGFHIGFFATDVPNAREMAIGDNGTVFVGSWTATNVYALVDSHHRGAADETYTIAKGLDNPVGVAFRQGSLYVAEMTKISRYDGIESRLANPPAPVVIYDQLPLESDHGVHFIRFGPDDKLYFGIGAPCNDCEVQDPEGTVSRMNPDGSDFEVFSRGVRNSVGLDWQPKTNVLWFTDNGRDLLGDDLPPDKLNCAPQIDMNFGFPYCQGGTILDPTYGDGHSCSEYIAPAMPLGPHVASIGMSFYTGSMFPDVYRGNVFIAEHGSWNRTVPDGCRVTMVRAADGCQASDYQAFATGWQLKDGSRWGRPADVVVAPDGALLVSDDLLGAVYRIVYEP